MSWFEATLCRSSVSSIDARIFNFLNEEREEDKLQISSFFWRCLMISYWLTNLAVCPKCVLVWKSIAPRSNNFLLFCFLLFFAVSAIFKFVGGFLHSAIHDEQNNCICSILNVKLISLNFCDASSHSNTHYKCISCHEWVVEVSLSLRFYSGYLITSFSLGT